MRTTHRNRLVVHVDIQVELLQGATRLQYKWAELHVVQGIEELEPHHVAVIEDGQAQCGRPVVRGNHRIFHRLGGIHHEPLGLGLGTRYFDALGVPAHAERLFLVIPRVGEPVIELVLLVVVQRIREHLHVGHPVLVGEGVAVHDAQRFLDIRPVEIHFVPVWQVATRGLVEIYQLATNNTAFLDAGIPHGLAVLVVFCTC